MASVRDFGADLSYVRRSVMRAEWSAEGRSPYYTQSRGPRRQRRICHMSDTLSRGRVVVGGLLRVEHPVTRPRRRRQTWPVYDTLSQCHKELGIGDGPNTCMQGLNHGVGRGGRVPLNLRAGRIIPSNILRFFYFYDFLKASMIFAKSSGRNPRRSRN